MPALITHNEKPVAAMIRDRLNFRFSTTHPLAKEQTNASYHIPRARRKPRL